MSWPGAHTAGTSYVKSVSSNWQVNYDSDVEDNVLIYAAKFWFESLVSGVSGGAAVGSRSASTFKKCHGILCGLLLLLSWTHAAVDLINVKWVEEVKSPSQLHWTGSSPGLNLLEMKAGCAVVVGWGSRRSMWSCLVMPYLLCKELDCDSRPSVKTFVCCSRDLNIGIGSHLVLIIYICYIAKALSASWKEFQVVVLVTRGEVFQSQDWVLRPFLFMMSAGLTYLVGIKPSGCIHKMWSQGWQQQSDLARSNSRDIQNHPIDYIDTVNYLKLSPRCCYTVLAASFWWVGHMIWCGCMRVC